MADTGPDTILLDLFRTNQVRERLIAASLDGLELPPEDYPLRPDRRRGALDADAARRADEDAALDGALPRRAARPARAHRARAQPGRQALVPDQPQPGRTEAAQAGASAFPCLRGVGRGAAWPGARRHAARPPGRTARRDRDRAQLRVRSATVSTCGVCGNMSTGRARSSV